MSRNARIEQDERNQDAIDRSPIVVPFTVPTIVGSELEYLERVLEERQLASSGRYSLEVAGQLEKMLGVKRAFITTSGSTALEMSALVADIRPGDEIIVPSFTFVTTASAFALRGAVPVFVDIRPDTLNLDESLVAKAITSSTRAIVPVHYAGVSCDMSELGRIADSRNLMIIEDTAQGFLSRYQDRYLGTTGSLSILSFHAAKNINCGEGGALLVNDEALVERAQTIWDKGTNKQDFLNGLTTEYSWCDLSSSFAPSEYIAALLLCQLQAAEQVTRERLAVWNRYHDAFEALEKEGKIQRPGIPVDTIHNGHIYFLIAGSNRERDALIKHLEADGITAHFHFSPLHLSVAGRKFGRTSGDLGRTEDLSRRLLRLPVFHGIDDESIEHVIDSVVRFYCD